MHPHESRPFPIAKAVPIDAPGYVIVQTSDRDFLVLFHQDNKTTLIDHTTTWDQAVAHIAKCIGVSFTFERGADYLSRLLYRNPVTSESDPRFIQAQ